MYERMFMKKVLCFFIIFILFIVVVHGEFIIDGELSRVSGGYCDVRIPGDTGNMISLTDDLEMDNFFTFRIEMIKEWGRNKIVLLYSPLRVNSKGNINRNIFFNTELFNDGESVKSFYKFDSYRISYQYDILKRDNFEIGLGLTAKIRNAEIKLENSSLNKISSKKNTGFVPIINFNFKYTPSEKLNILIKGDGLASSQGRAFDIFTGLYYKINEIYSLKTGYRFLEGGSDNEEVYSFSYFHYLVFGFKINLSQI